MAELIFKKIHFLVALIIKLYFFLKLKLLKQLIQILLVNQLYLKFLSQNHIINGTNIAELIFKNIHFLVALII